MSNNKRILHVEDEETTQIYIKSLLKEQGELVQVSSISEAEQLFDNQEFDLVLLDFTLPDGSGQNLIKQVQSLNPAPPIIVLSGHELTKNIPGVEKVLTKGRYQDDDLVELVHSILFKNNH